MTDPTSLTFMAFLTGLVVLFPEEAKELAFHLWIDMMLFYMNLRLRWATWRVYRKMKAAMADSGLEIPPYYYVRIQDRGWGLEELDDED